MNNTSQENSPVVEKLTYTTREVCTALGIGNTTLWRLRARGQLVPIPGLRHKLYSVKAVRRFAETGITDTKGKQ